MERNTILAIVLSAVVLFAYQSIFVPPKKSQTVNSSQLNSTQSFTSQNAASSLTPASVGQGTTKLIVKASDFTIHSTIEDIYFTKMGGSLHKVDFVNNGPFPVTDVLSVDGFDNVPYKGEQMGDKTISLVYQNEQWQIIKTYEMGDDNLINARMEIKNLSEMSILTDFNITALAIDSSSIDLSASSVSSVNPGTKTTTSRESVLFEYSVYTKSRVFRKGSAFKFNEKNNKSANVPVNWVGFRDHYNAFIVKPKFQTKAYEITTVNDQELNISLKPESKNLAPGQSVIYDFKIYAGPQNPWIMKKYDEGFEKIIAFSNFAIIEWVGQAIYHIIPIFHNIFKSWGISIILISLMIYGITYPMTMKSMMSMRKMQQVQPKITALKERYKNDPQKMNAEMMEIYRREKINPLGGCLPLLIQMPFFMALYQILWRAQYFQGQGFLWIKDLSQPDRLIIFPFYLPFFGNELNILPILTGGIMFIQQKISSKNMVVTDEQQAMQQKMMMYILPVMMTCMFYKFASAWAIYFMIYYILSTVTQWRIARLAGTK